MPGPLPDEQARRRNEPTIPSTHLPALGYDGYKPPAPSSLDEAGVAWWEWAWSTPQAAAWDIGVLSMLARRARLEDDLRVLDTIELGEVPARELTDKELRAFARNLQESIRVLVRMAGGEISVMREMRELEDRLGLNPKAAASLRWKFVGKKDDPQGALELDDDDEVTKRRREREARLAAVT